MEKLHKASELKGIPIAQLRRIAINSKTDMLVEAIGNALNKKLKNYSSLVSITHDYEIKAVITNKTAKVSLESKESPGQKFQHRNDPKELHCFSYEQLKRDAECSQGIYRGKLYGTIEQCSCSKEVDCSDCAASGVCHVCDGKKQVTCTVCEGNKQCISCEGTGRYTCENCEGDGECPECNNGWYICDSCSGDGEMSCPDCNGTGNYIDETCNKCNGSGSRRNGSKCYTCGGTGRYVVECKRCDGTGRAECDNCDGDGGWDCEECHGTGKCSHCRGNGDFKCRACDGSGICGKCMGKGKIWCPDCQGKGICFTCKGSTKIECPKCKGFGTYQTYMEYTFEENEMSKLFCSLPIGQNNIADIIGNICYEGVIYDFFAQKANIYNTTDVIKTLSGHHSDVLQQWIAIEKNSTFSKDTVNNDYLNTHIRLMKILVTKVVFNCNSSNFNVYIVGNSQIVFYDKLPGFKDSFIGGFKKLFH